MDSNRIDSTAAALPALADANGLQIAHESFGSEGDTPILLIMGLGTQMIWWDDAFCAGLAARGFHVLRFDNRDVGLSTHLDDAAAPDMAAVLGGDTSSAVYLLGDMADDAFGLLDALGLDSAHVAGISMGGMIGQTMAIQEPARVRSLVSIMSTTGDREVGQPTDEAVQALFKPMPRTREEAIERTVETWGVIRSPGFDWDEARVRRLAELSWERAVDPAGFARQFAAIIASGDRTPQLRQLEMPTLVVHGDADILVQPSGGQATADAIPGAELMTVEGMGHDVPQGIHERLIEAIEQTARRGEEALVEA